MDFNNLYNTMHKYKIDCETFPDKSQIQKMVTGSGGSNNIILILSDLDVGSNVKSDVKFIAKIIPDFFHRNYKIKPNNDQLEIQFYQFFTKKYLLTNRTPHIVGIYNHQHCDHIKKLLLKINPYKKTCPTYEDFLIKKISISDVEIRICTLLYEHEMKILDSQYDVVLLEYCETSLSEFLLEFIRKIFDEDSNYMLDEFFHIMKRILFQLIFTLAIIQDDYPGFSHRDFFIRNILLLVSNNHSSTEYVAYHYKQKIFYLPANGFYSKMNDFGLSIIVNELEPSTYVYDKYTDKTFRKNPFNKKNDIYNLLYDIYTEIVRNMKPDLEKIDLVIDFMDPFIDTTTIDKIDMINSIKLMDTWTIDGIKILENTVSTPDEYLMKTDIFTQFQDLPKNAIIIQHYNSPRKDH